MGKIIGIDLGTGNSCAAVMEGNKPTIIVNSEGARTTPSVVAFTSNGERKVGAPAKRQATINATNTVSSIKRFMGNAFDEVQKEIKMVPYKVECSSNNTPKVSIDGKLYTPQEISSMILQSIKKSAEDYLGEPVTDAVITVPAYFSDSQRKATKEAGEIAGLNVRRIINEPTAAALAYGLDKLDGNRKIAVFDAGQGTFVISILDLGDGVFEVLSTNGDTHLGGDDIDAVLVDWIADTFKADEGVDLRKDPMALQRIKEAAEKAKIELSSQVSTEISLPYITAIDGVPKHINNVTLTRAKFESMIQPVVDRCVAPCKNALADAKLTASEIDDIILVGGTTRIPMIQKLVKDIFGKEPNKSANPDEVVALGASIQGSVLANEQTGILLLDVTPLNLNITTEGKFAACMIEANTTIPVSKSHVFSTAVDNQPAVSIEVTQGNRKFASDNKKIGMFNLEGIMPAPRGIPQIEVSFDIDANGILTVKATDKATGKSQDIRIEGSSGLSDEDIAKMRADAEANAEADNKAAERIKKINDAESLIYVTEKQISEFSDKMTDDEKSAINSALSDLKAVYDVPDADRDLTSIEEASKKLTEAWYPITTRLYKADDSSAPGFDPSSIFGKGF